MKRLVLFTLLCIIFSTLSAQKEIEALTSRVTKLEEFEKIRNEKLDLQIKTLRLEADSTLEAKKKDLDEKINDLKSRALVFSLILSSLTLIGIVSFLWAGRKYVNTQMKNRIDSLVQEKVTEFQQMIAMQEIESRVKRDKALLVLSPNETTRRQIAELIAGFGFSPSNVKYQFVNNRVDVEEVNMDTSNIIIINDIKSNFDRTLLKKLLQNAKGNNVFLGYATGEEQLPRDPKMNFANSKFTFYRNLIDLLKYDEVVSKTNS